MSNNPYGAGGNPYEQPNSQQSQSNGSGRPAFVDPYQPIDRQPAYPPAVTRNELKQEREDFKEQRRIATSATGGRAEIGSMPMHSGASRTAAAVCLVLAAVMTLGHISVLALGVVAIFYGVAKTALVKKWSGNAFNFLLTYLVVATAVFVVFWVVDAMSGETLHEEVGNWVRYAFATILGVGAVVAAMSKYFRLPSLFRPLSS